MPKPSTKRFSRVQAVKAIARARVGTPPPAQVLPDPKQKQLREPRHKQTLADLLRPEFHLDPSQGDPR